MNLPGIRLESGWRFQSAATNDEDAASRAVNDRDWETLPSLENWRQAISAATGFLWLRQTVNLKPFDVCVVYFLHVDAVPGNVSFFVNGHHIGNHRANGGIFAEDVTRYVHLDSNLVAVRLDCTKIKGEHFSGVRLQPVPCDEL